MTVELTSDKRTARAFVPGHITGLFRIYDEHPDPLHRGSRGAGFSVSVGTLTTITVIETDEPTIKTKYNERKIHALVTETVVEKLSEDYNMTLSAEITHTSDLPIGVGFGASGAGALGTALALSSIIAPELEFNSASQYAHIAEVVNHAGLGDVISQTVGGVEIRTQAGAPGLGRIQSIPYSHDYTVLLAGSPGLNTKDILTDPESRENINRMGDYLLDELSKEPHLEKICDVSREFAASIDLEKPRIIEALDALYKKGLNLSSQVMLGDSVFCICKPSEVDQGRSILTNYWNEEEILETSISPSGGRLL